jgi:cold shock protein
MAERVRGTCRWFNPTKGYGFIIQDGSNPKSKNSQDVFVHYSALDGDGYKSLNEGDIVEFEIIKGEKGLSASNVVIVKG